MYKFKTGPRRRFEHGQVIQRLQGKTYFRGEKDLKDDELLQNIAHCTSDHKLNAPH